MATASGSQRSSPERVGFLQLLRRNKPYRALFLSQVTGQTGDWLNLLAVFQLAARTSDPGIVVALVLAIHYASAFVLGPLAGILADRLNRRSLLVALDLIRVPIVLGFLLIDASSVALLGLATAQYALGALFEPTRQALTQSLASGRELVAANSLGAATYGATGGAGMLIGGILVATHGPQVCFVVDAATFIASAVLLLRIPRALGDRKKEEHRQSSDGSWGAVLRVARADPRFRSAIVIRAIIGLSGGAYWVVGIRLAQGPLAVGDQGSVSNALVNAIMFLGAVLAGHFMNRFHGDERRIPRAVSQLQLWRAGLILLLGTAAFLGQQVLALGIAMVALSMLGLTIAGAMMYIAAIQLLKELTPADMHGRVFALDLGLMNLTFGASALGAGLVSDWTTLGPFALCAGLAFGLIPVWWLWMRTYGHWHTVTSPACQSAAATRSA